MIEVDLSFTKDPVWISNREKQWAEIVEDVSEELTRREVKKIKDYFFTGVIPQDVLGANDILAFFPKHDIESALYCMNKCIEFGLDPGVEFCGFDSMISVGFGRYECAPGESLSDLFKYVFTDTYNPELKFPFLLANETEHRPLTIKPGNLFSRAGYDFYICLEDGKDCMWYDLADYYFSLFPYGDECAFNDNELSDLDEKGIRGRFRSTMSFCFNPPRELLESPYKDRGLRFLKEFKEHMDALETYPGDLKRIWENVKSEAGA